MRSINFSFGKKQRLFLEKAFVSEPYQQLKWCKGMKLVAMNREATPTDLGD
jgi:hypothetical protein